MEVASFKNHFVELSDAAERRLSSFYGYFSRSRTRSGAASLIIYTILFAVFFIITFGNRISAVGFLLGADGLEQYVPFLRALRKALLQLFESIAAGTPALPMTDLNYCFGGDSLTMVYADMLPMLPFYVFSVLFPEEMMPQFMTVGVVLFSYLGGLSFIRMCVYFRQNVMIAGPTAPLYVFCGCYTGTLVYNPHFLYMTIAFPIMLIGIDRVIHDRNGIPLTLAVAFLGLCGVNLLVYCMPFVVIFAAIRVFYVHRGRFAAALIKYFLIGTLYTLLGIMTAGVLLLPYMAALLSSVRTLGDPGLSVTEYLTPDLENIYNYFTDTTDLNGVSTATMPFFMYAFVRTEKNKELRAYGIAALTATGLPLVLYGLNGFQYNIERWAFIFALLACFMLVRYLPEVAGGCEYEPGTAVCAVICALLFTLPIGKYAVIPVLVLLLFIRPLRKTAACIKDKLIKLIAFIKSGFSGAQKPLLLVAAVAAALIILLAALLIVSMQAYEILGFVLAAFLLFAAVTVFAGKTGKRFLSGALTLAGCAAIALMQIVPSNEANEISPDIVQFIDHINSEEEPLADQKNNWYSELSFIEYEVEEKGKTDQPGGSDTTERKDHTVNGVNVIVDTHMLNASLGRNFGLATIFNSIIPGDLMRFLDRIGIDDKSRESFGVITGFSGRQELYSLFGIEKTYSLDRISPVYGMELSETAVFPDRNNIERDFYIYDNKYALPTGTAYDRCMSRESFESFNSAELPYAMLDAVYLEGYGGTTEEISRICPDECRTVNEKVSRGKTTTGIECFDNTVTLGESVKDCFLYIEFGGVKTGSMWFQAYEFLDIYINDETFTRFQMNSALYRSEFPWINISDHYTLPLGYMEDDIDKITFISTFDFSSVKLYKVPRSFFTGAVADRQSEAMYDVHTGVNTLTGHTDFPEDRILSVEMLYSSGWEAFIDGERTNTYKANGLFIGIPVPAGEHEIKLVYHTPLIYEGLALTGAGIIIIITIAFISRRKERNRRQ